MTKYTIIDDFKVEPHFENSELTIGQWFVFNGVGFSQSDLPMEGIPVQVLRPDGFSLQTKIIKSRLNPNGSIAVQLLNLSSADVPRLSLVVVFE